MIRHPTVKENRNMNQDQQTCLHIIWCTFHWTWLMQLHSRSSFRVAKATIFSTMVFELLGIHWLSIECEHSWMCHFFAKRLRGFMKWRSPDRSPDWMSANHAKVCLPGWSNLTELEKTETSKRYHKVSHGFQKKIYIYILKNKYNIIIYKYIFIIYVYIHGFPWFTKGGSIFDYRKGVVNISFPRWSSPQYIWNLRGPNPKCPNATFYLKEISPY